jgi:hypothetical protein
VSQRSLLAALAALTLAAACDKPLTVEQQIIATIRDMEALIEDGERRAFMEHIAPDFSGRNGSMNRDQVRALVIFRLNRHKKLRAQLFPIQVEETAPGRAIARFRALVTGGAGWLPESGQVFDFVTQWRLDDDEWLLIGADWKPVDLERALDEVL